MINVYFVRHGKTVCNTDKIIQDDNDKLNELGILQANTIAERIKSIPIEKIITSPLPRTYDTAMAISKKIGITLEIQDLLREKKNPTSLIGLSHTDQRVLDANETRKKNQSLDPNWKFEDEEGFIELKSRALEVLSILQKQTQNNILVVTHGALMRYILGCMIFGEKLEKNTLDPIFKSFVLNNTGISLCTYGTEDISKPPRWRVVSWNDTTHL